MKERAEGVEVSRGEGRGEGEGDMKEKEEEPLFHLRLRERVS
jgi:hypothetical protein